MYRRPPTNGGSTATARPSCGAIGASAAENRQQKARETRGRMGLSVQKPPALADSLLLSVFVVELGVIVWMLLTEPDMLLLLVRLLLVVAVAINATKLAFYYGGGYVSRTFLRHLGDPLKKRVAMKKWCDQSWQLTIHVAMAGFEFVVLRDETWWHDTKTVWNGGAEGCTYPEHQFRTKLLYVAQLAIWIYTAFSCKFLEEVRKDYLIMMTHHVVTIALVTWSYAIGFLPIGVIVLFVHDLSDIPLDLLKMANYLKLEGRRGAFMSEILFVILIADWIYFRLWLFPTKLLNTTLFESREACLSPDAAHDYWTISPLIPTWFFINALLIALFCLHIWWGFLIVRLLVGVIKKGAHETGKDEYEGASDESDDEQDTKED